MQFCICPSKSRQQNRQKHPEITSGKPSSPRCVSKYSFTKLSGPRKQYYGVKYSKLQQTLSIFDISSFSQTLYIYICYPSFAKQNQFSLPLNRNIFLMVHVHWFSCKYLELLKRNKTSFGLN